MNETLRSIGKKTAKEIGMTNFSSKPFDMLVVSDQKELPGEQSSLEQREIWKVG